MNSANADPTTAFQMLLATGRTYGLSMSVPRLEGSRRLGIVVYPLTPEVVNVTADRSHNFSVPDVPGNVVISGKVTDEAGRGLSNAFVAAATQAVTGASNMGFSAGTVTDAQGNYSMTVLSGTYRLLFTPSIPAP